ncbi:tetratricopeptide repeat protein [Flexithrix dorotheae]|uniref:tetratricopeptide repeat protein n=1 Tax=Flexithrix dorotheae TaxID=70993 RepID=UPI00036E5F36|nr:hypothetical protein [Flexithrix dorotheae]
MQISKEALFQASRIIHSKDTLFSIPDDVTIEWREALFQILEGEYSRDVINQCISNGSRVNAKKSDQEDSIWESIHSQENEILHQTLAVIELYFHFAEKAKEGFVKNEREEKLGKFYRKLELKVGDKRKVSLLKKNLLNKFKREKYQKTLFIPASILPVSLDFVLRFSSLWVFNLIFFFQGDVGQIFALLFFLLKIIGIALVVLFFAKLRQKKVGQYYENLFSNFKDEKPSRIKIQPKAWQFTLIVLMAAFEGNLMYVLFDEFSDIDYFLVGYIGLFFALITFLYLYFVLNTISPGKLKISKLLALKKQELTFQQKLSADENDEAFVRLETGFVSKKQRIEAYVIESTLFGALSFSAFLQLIANDLITLAGVEDFVVLYNDVFNMLLLLNFEGLFNSMGIMTEKTHVFSILAILTLLCSIMFLVVIASRLRFRDVSDKLEQCFNLIRSLNNKEEHLLLKEHVSKEDEKRFKLLNQKILNQLNEANAYVREINPIAGFMQYFRDLGVVIFFIILIASGLFFSKFLAIAFSLLAVFTILYFNSEAFIKKGKAAYYWFKDDFFYIGKTYLLPISSGIVGFMVLLAFLGQFNYKWQPLATLGFTLLSLVRVVQIFFSSEKETEWRQNADAGLIKVFKLNKIKKIGWILAELSLYWFLYLVLFNQNQFSVLLLLTTMLLYTALLANKSLIVLNRSVWSYLLGINFIILFIAIFSNFLGLDFADFQLQMVLIGQGLLIVALILKKIKLDGMLWRSLLLSNLLCLGIFFYKEELKVAFNYGNINPGHISRFMEIEEFNEREENTNLERYEELCKWYMNEYLLSFSEEKQPEIVYGFLSDLQSWVGDSTFLNKSIEWTDRSLEKSNSSDLAYLKGLIYKKLHEPEKAIQSFKQGVEYYEINPGKMRPEVFYNSLANTLLKSSLDSGKSQQALEYAKLAFEESFFYTYNYMAALFRLKKRDEAVQLLEGGELGASNIGTKNDRNYYSANLIFSTTDDSVFLELALNFINKTTDLKKDPKKAALKTKILCKLNKKDAWEWMELSATLYEKETDPKVKSRGLNNIVAQSYDILATKSPEQQQKALGWIKAAISLREEDNYVFRSTLAMVLSAIGEHEQAIREAQKVIARGFEVDRHFIDPGIYFESSFVMLHSGADSTQLLKARDWSRKSVEFDPFNYDHWDNYVNILEKVGPPLEYKKAIEEKRKLGLQLEKEEPELL